mmetsp:Transcript_45794/g.145991  ORF Transcript_45794/g.145991 Transcript_45794/m.145991 type:complete len:206 (+) Transcript_45794:180-797(+)
MPAICSSSDVGYWVGWCCARRSSLSMCISVVFPALSSPCDANAATCVRAWPRGPLAREPPPGRAGGAEMSGGHGTAGRARARGHRRGDLGNGSSPRSPSARHPRLVLPARGRGEGGGFLPERNRGLARGGPGTGSWHSCSTARGTGASRGTCPIGGGSQHARQGPNPSDRARPPSRPDSQASATSPSARPPACPHAFRTGGLEEP